MLSNFLRIGAVGVKLVLHSRKRFISHSARETVAFSYSPKWNLRLYCEFGELSGLLQPRQQV